MLGLQQHGTLVNCIYQSIQPLLVWNSSIFSVQHTLAHLLFWGIFYSLFQSATFLASSPLFLLVSCNVLSGNFFRFATANSIFATFRDADILLGASLFSSKFYSGRCFYSERSAVGFLNCFNQKSCWDPGILSHLSRYTHHHELQLKDKKTSLFGDKPVTVFWRCYCLDYYRLVLAVLSVQLVCVLNNSDTRTSLGHSLLGKFLFCCCTIMCDSFGKASSFGSCFCAILLPSGKMGGFRSTCILVKLQMVMLQS